MGSRCKFRSPDVCKEEEAYLKATVQASYEQMEQARTRLLELLHHLEHQLAYKKRTEIVVEMVAQLEEEGQFPQADYAFDNGVLTLELTRLIESKGKHWVSEVESSRHILWKDEWRRIDDVATELRQTHPESFRRVVGALSQWGAETVLGLYQECPAQAVWTQTDSDGA